ncbi:hypothetical protein D3C73_897040 [compost metagenome]
MSYRLYGMLGSHQLHRQFHWGYKHIELCHRIILTHHWKRFFEVDPGLFHLLG